MFDTIEDDFGLNPPPLFFLFFLFPFFFSFRSSFRASGAVVRGARFVGDVSYSY